MSELVMVVSKTGMKYVGKPVNFKVASDTDINYVHNKENLVLEETILTSEFMSNNGLIIMGTILGTTTFPIEGLTVTKLDSKSPYYRNYYQTTSNIELTKETKIPLKNQ